MDSSDIFREGTLAVIVPAYQEGENISRFYRSLASVMQSASIPFSLFFIDDGSTDNTWSLISQLARAHGCVAGLRLSRNFGKEAAIFAGLTEAVRSSAAACIIMDCDLQHPPEAAVKMYRIWQTQPVELVEGVRQNSGSPNPIYRLFSAFFYQLLYISSGVSLKGASDFQLLDIQAAQALLSCPERRTFFRGLTRWMGFSAVRYPFTVSPRQVGKSKWKLSKLISYALGSITSFSALPMQAVTCCGALFFLFSLILGIDTLVKKFRGVSAEGFTTVILLLLIVGGIIMFSLGIIGYYLARIYDEVRLRPRYLVRQYAQRKEEPCDLSSAGKEEGI